MDELALDQFTLQANVEDKRCLLGIMRLLLTGGLLSADRIQRRRNKGRAVCSCDGESFVDVLHISWQCPHFAALRQPLDHLKGWLNTLPRVFLYATLVPKFMHASVDDIELIQLTLCRIWQAYTQRYLEGVEIEAAKRLASLPQQVPAADVGGAEQTAVIENGHRIVAHDTGVIYCVKCGVYTRNPQHRRLKISVRPCKFRESPQHMWLDKPGAHRNDAKLDLAWQKVLSDNNKGNHDLAWNRKIGKIPGRNDEGHIWCNRCGRSWPWRFRCANLPRSKCTASRTTSSWIPVPLRRLSMKATPPRPAEAYIDEQNDDLSKKGRWQLRLRAVSSAEDDEFEYVEHMGFCIKCHCFDCTCRQDTTGGTSPVQGIG